MTDTDGRYRSGEPRSDGSAGGTRPGAGSDRADGHHQAQPQAEPADGAAAFGFGVAGEAHRAAVAITVGSDFRGSGFFVAQGVAVTAAHVIADAGVAPITVTGPRTTYDVPPSGVRAHPAKSDGGRFYPVPDLAVLRGTAWGPHPVARLAAVDPAPGTEVSALGYSTHTPTPGVQPDSLALRVGGRSGDFVRVIGDGIREGFSGSMLVDRDGLVVGVIKASRSYAGALGGWFTPVSALHAVLGTTPLPRPGPGARGEARAEAEPDAGPGPGAPAGATPRTTPEPGAPAGATPRTRPEPGAPAGPGPANPTPTDADLVDALMAFPTLARSEARFDLLDRMGDHLGLPHSFEVEERSARRDHLYRLVLSCRQFRDERAAFTALHTAMEEIVPYDRALERLGELVGRIVTPRAG